MVSRCKATTQAGSPCAAQPVREDGYCYWHSPAKAADRQAARRRGGAARSNRSRARRQIPDPLTPEELNGWLSLLFVRVAAGAMEPKIGTAAATIARAILDVRTATEVETRLAELESRAGLRNDRRFA